MKKRTVTILMATYNGSKHIKNQLLSLQQQKFNDWTLYIQDDGSDDDTIKIINQFQLNDTRIHLIDNETPHQGAGKNFLSLVKYSQADYTFFCDQDDIWLENKISDMVQCAEKCKLADNLQPSIVYADGYAFSDETGEIDFCGISHNHATDLKGFLFFNGGYQGCSILFNQSMVKFLIEYKGEIHLHDDIISLIAHALGEVHFLPKKLMLYRQHSKAVTGLKDFNRNLIHKYKSNVNYLLSKKIFLVKKSFYENYKSILTDEKEKAFYYFMEFGLAENKLAQLLYLIRGKFTLNQSFIKLLLKFFLRRKFDS